MYKFDKTFLILFFQPSCLKLLFMISLILTIFSVTPLTVVPVPALLVTRYLRAAILWYEMQTFVS